MTTLRNNIIRMMDAAFAWAFSYVFGKVVVLTIVPAVGMTCMQCGGCSGGCGRTA